MSQTRRRLNKINTFFFGNYNNLFKKLYNVTFYFRVFALLDRKTNVKPVSTGTSNEAYNNIVLSFPFMFKALTLFSKCLFTIHTGIFDGKFHCYTCFVNRFQTTRKRNVTFVNPVLGQKSDLAR